MKFKILLTILPLYLSLLSNGQNIYSALQHNRKEEIRNKVATQIIEENTFFNSNGKEINKNIKLLNEYNLVLVEERYGEDGKLKAKLTYEYDSTGLKSLWRKFERWNSGRYSMETAFYEYDNKGYLIKTTDKNSQGNVIQQTLLLNNEKGHPIELQLLDGKGNSFCFEYAKYDYDKNKAYTEVKSNSGNTLSSDTLSIEFNKQEIQEPGKEYNKQGDLIRTKGSVREYVYDEFGNWTLLKMHKLEKGKKKNNRVFKRKIKYKE
ncbi:hypothetical protein [Rufibacter roseus]|uniref:YD repeat-containing protein n=1 Tax=Rufibacter roseus TaxID=1567108 RepID=A0ABW2DQ38_9BACT|nr:hypothetical protein [Rufibacter roseus]